MSAETAGKLDIEPDHCALLIIDVQDRLAAAMPDEQRCRIERNVVILIELARRFRMPIVVTQQYPKGLGPTTEAVESALGQVAGNLHRFDKTEFSACAAQPFAEIWKTVDRSQWVVAGMETHVCVYQTVRNLIEAGAQVHVPCDAVASRTDDNRRTGLALIERAGAVPTSTEVVVFDVLGRAGGDDFKALSKMVR